MALSKIQGIEGQVTPNLGRRNLIINGAMQVAQRATTFDYDTPSGNIYTTVDRFALYKSTGTYEVTNTQSTDAPVGFSHSYKLVCDTAYTPSASDNFGINQNIEVSSGLQRFGFGTSEAKDITFSFYVKGTPKTYTFQANYVGTDGEQKTQMKTFTVTNTWTRKVITFSAGGTSSSVGIEPDLTSQGFNFRVWLASGPDDISSEITTWTANPSPTYKAATGQGNFFSDVGNEFSITGVQLEVGDTATDFEHRSYGEELSLCQRYCFVFTQASGEYGGLITAANAYSTTNMQGGRSLPVTMRAKPTLSFTGNIQLSEGSSTKNSSATSIIGNGSSINQLHFWVGNFSGLTTNRNYFGNMQTAGNTFTASAEL
jgi:hypothetical protein